MDYNNYKLYFRDLGADTNMNFRFHESDTLDIDKITSIYESLLKNFKDRGQIKSEEKLAIEYEYFKGKNSTSVYIRDWWNRFGYEKGRIFKHTLIFLFLFSVITFFFFDFLQENIYKQQAAAINLYKPNNLPKQKGIRVNTTVFGGRLWMIFQRLWFSFVYTALIFFLFSLKIDELVFTPKVKNIFGVAYIILVYTVGIICIAYMADFVLQK